MGFYVGGNLGYHSGQDSISSSANPFGWGTDAAGVIDSRSPTWLDPRGPAVGGQIGFNWQIRNVVFGWEADGDWLGGAVNRRFTFLNAISVADGDFMYNSSAANVVATLRPRIGLARNWRKWAPMAPAFPSPAACTLPSRFNNCTMAAAFSPRTLRRKRARFSNFTSSAV